MSYQLRGVRVKLLIGFGLIVLICTIFIWESFLRVSASSSINLQLQSASLLQQPVLLSDFTLTDHEKQKFTNEELKGRWHLLAYCYLHCPDICPTTLLLLNNLMLRLQNEQRYEDVQLLFYTVDPERDTPSLLAEYISFFGEGVIGLTAKPYFAKEETSIKQDSQLQQGFEVELGIKVKIEQSNATGDEKVKPSYQVSHGVAIYLLNPQGKLHAVFQPSIDPFGIRKFSLEQLHHDYLLLRANALM